MVLSGLDVYAHTSTSPSAKIQQLWSRRHFSVEGWSRCLMVFRRAQRGLWTLYEVSCCAESNPSTLTARQMLGWEQQDHVLSDLWCNKVTAEELNEQESFYLHSAALIFEDPTKERRNPAGRGDGVLSPGQRLEIFRWSHLCMEEAQQQRLASAGHRRGKGTFYCS